MASTSQPMICSQPWKALYIIFYFASIPILLPFWIFHYAPRSFRPHPKWTYHQALMNQILHSILHFTSAIRMKTDQSLEPGAEGDRFVVIKPTEDGFYGGIVNDPEIRPAAIGAVWYPSPYKPEDRLNKTFIIHFHGGAVSSQSYH